MRNSENKLKIMGQTFGLAVLLGAIALQAGSSQLRAETNASTSQAHTESREGMVTLARHTAPKVLDGRAVRLSHYNPEQKLRLALGIKPPHMAEEEKFIQELVTKGSPNFHKFLTSEQWNERFAPSTEDEQKVVDWATSQGLTITKRYPNRLIVDVEAPAGTIEQAFGVTINNYQVGEEVDFANDRDPVIPGSLQGTLFSVLGLNSIDRFHRLKVGGEKQKGPDYVAGAAIAEGGSVHGDGDPNRSPEARRAAALLSTNATPEDGPPLDDGVADPANITSSEAYDYDALHAISHCCNEPGASGGSPPESSIALVTYGNFQTSDVETFFSHYGLAYSLNWYYVNGSGYPGQDDEAPLDVEYSTAMSNSYGSYQNTAHVFVYEAPNGQYATYADIYEDIQSDDHARVVSTSYGWEEGVGFSDSEANNTMHGIFNNLVGVGGTLIASAGDNGAADGCQATLAVDYPASDPDFIAAGGTELTLNSSGNWVSEYAWIGETYSGACSSNHGGGGGGGSSNFAAPSWQSFLGYSNRVLPDISLTANPDVMGEWYYYNGTWYDEGGTSIVAPELAGFFAQENSYLDYVGAKCGAGSSACSPVGLASPFLYYDGHDGAPHNPFYDTTYGCNSNDITAAYGLGSYCAGTGYDLATGWGSANMLQLAWGINWELIPAYGAPSIAFTSGPSTNVWYNTNQTIAWVLSDAGSGSYPAPGVAGFTQGWDSIPADPQSEPHGGYGNSFYSGPQYAFSTNGCLQFVADGCAGGSGQGCHTVHVEGWDNQGRTTTGTYGPVCYDSVAPTITAADNPAGASSGYVNKSVVVTLTSSDSGGSGASGIYKTYYAINTGACSPSTVGSCTVYSGPITISSQGANYVYYFTEDNAGNFSTESYIYAEIDTTAPVTSASLSGDLASGTYYSNVKVTLSATDNLSGVQHTYYTFDGGGQVTYSAPFTVTSLGAHTLKYWSVDNATNTESTHTLTFTIAAGTPAVMASPAPSGRLAGPNVTFSWSAPAGATGYALWIGSTGVGSENIYSTGVHTPTSLAVSGLPTNGETLYVRLYTSFNGTLKSNDYTYTASKQGAMSSPAPSSTLVGPNVTFSWAAGTPATGYAIWIGSTGVGSENVYSTGVHTPTSVAVSGLPTNGETLYVRLWTSFNGTLASTDYTYTTAKQAVMSSPAPSSTLVGPNVTFSWAAGTGAAGYAIWIGSTGVGSENLYSTGVHTTTSAAVAGLPTNGETIYVRLWTSFGGTLASTDYTYTAAKQAVLTTPAPGTTLAGSSVTFDWNAGTGGASGYAIWIGSTGAGSSNLYSTGVHTNLSASVTGLPTNGETIYVRIWTSFNGTLVSTDYTYKAE